MSEFVATIYVKAIVRRCYFGVDFVIFGTWRTVQLYTIDVLNMKVEWVRTENVKCSKPLKKGFPNTFGSYFLHSNGSP